MKKIPVGISSCLLGHNVRYDGGNKKDAYIIKTLGRYFDFFSFCPETGIGLDTPRTPIHLVKKNNTVRCIDIKNSELDFTAPLRDYAFQQKQQFQNLCGYILKKGSPSCGMEEVKIFESNRYHREGIGIYAKEMMRIAPLLPVEEEGRLGNSQLRENFIRRVYVLHRWKLMLLEGLSINSLAQFHERHKLIIMSHGDDGELGKIIDKIDRDDIEAITAQYISLLMTILKNVATRNQHVKVLQHIQGHLQKQLNAEDNTQLCEIIDQYHQGLIPLILPIALLKHHSHNHPEHSIYNSCYMSPCPQELLLTNTL